MNKIAKLLTASTLVFGLVGCGIASNTGVNLNSKLSAKKVRTGAKWTILVHMAAENNLYSAGLKDLNEMEAGLNSDDVNVVVLFDGTKDGDSCIYQIKHDNGLNSTIISDKIDDAGAVLPANHEINSGDPTVLAKFMAWAAKKYPAQHTMLGIWNHGSGLFTNTNSTTVFRGFAWDDRGGNMKTKDLSGTILPAFQQAAGQPLDVLGFDACLMAHVEIGYQINGMANYLVASEETEPGDGWDYLNWLTNVSKNPNMTPAELGNALVDAYGKSYSAGGSQAGSRPQDVTLSCTDVNALNTLMVPAMNTFVDASIAQMATAKTTLVADRSKTVTFYNSDCADIGHFAKLVGAEPSLDAGIVAAAKGMDQAMNKAVLSHVGLGKFANATGLVAYFPKAAQSYNSKYDNAAEVAFAKEAWGKFLKAYK